MSKKKKEYLHKDTSLNSSYCYKPDGHIKGRILGIDFTKNQEQRELIRLINQNNLPIIYCFGDAGTGKTFTALAAAIDLIKIQKKYSKIFYIREPLEVGKSLGFLPGDIGEKYGVYLGGLQDNLEHISEFSGINVNDMKSCIECIPPQFTRGRSIENSIILIDEAQNLSLETIQTLLTRMGQFCKVVLMGSMNQIDIKGKTRENNDFKKSYEILNESNKELKIMEGITLIKSERSEYCKIIDEAFQNYKNNN